jgi:homoserine dehydrogenase
MKIAIIGFGVVGSGVAEVFYRNRDRIETQAGRGLDIKYIVDVRSLADTPWADKWTTDFEKVVSDPEVGVVVETIGGLHPAFEFSMRSLKAGKHVVTSNKELVATHGAALIQAAREKGVNYLFEASTGGGIPLIHPLHRCLASGEILEIGGILNGTSNFILTHMISDGMSFDQALSLAQKNGYAEANPKADVEGEDACRKICILASLVFGRHVYPQEVHTQGITRLTLDDVAAAAAAGYVVKLIGRAKKRGDGSLTAMVTPALLAKSSRMANVSDVFNAVLVRGADVGEIMFYGRGAGKLPTASAVLSDVVDAVRSGGHIGTLDWEDSMADTVGDHLEDVTPFMLRAGGGAQQALTGLFGRLRFVEYGDRGEMAAITEPISAGRMQTLCAEAEKQGVSILSALPVLEY